MKKIFLLLLFPLLLIDRGFAYSDWTNQFITAFEQKLQTMDANQQKDYFKLIQSILDAPQVKNNSKAEIKGLVSELNIRLQSKSWKKLAFEAKKNDETTYQIKASDEISYQTLEYIDFDQVRRAWLSWHNELRAVEGLEPYHYHSDLEKSAKSWSDQLASLAIKSWTHKRKQTDGYYSYTSIKERFSDLGIFFPKETGGKSAFSESVGYRSFNCASNDCTEAFITATKRVFDTFASEGKNGPHYKAIVMPHFKQMGLGFQLDEAKKTIYVVIHYAGDLLESS